MPARRSPDKDQTQRALESERARWRQIRRLLDTLEATPLSEREGRLARMCPDPGLRREVSALLAAQTASQDYLDALGRPFGRVSKPAGSDLIGRRVGPYRLIQPVGSGGMGLVFEAERADGAFRQRVAIKLLTNALGRSDVRNRFLAERQILAGLEHPSIARILDGGVTDDGTPWFAMEYVRGCPINQYCDRKRLRIPDRLRLFLQVCHAVEHAHRRLVVHRDLKPANVLVTDKGEVKLLDFGIAKLMGPATADNAFPPTRTLLRLMTPEYASPEQVLGQAVTTASDVYQLGLLLYELLSGHRPYTLHHGGAGELERVICEQLPTRLSAVVARHASIPPESNGASTLWAICTARGSSPAGLRRRLRGDLDNIVLKALNKEPARRYGSADRLAQDIQQHLSGLPVAARSYGWFYRGRKFVGRHVAGTVLVAALIIVTAGMSGFHTLRVQTERDQAELARDRAELETAKARQISEFLANLFRGADPRTARGAELTARELLDRGVERVERELVDQPEVQADMLEVLGSTYLELGIYDSAEHLLLQVLEQRRARLPPTDPKIAETLRNLGLIRFYQGEYESARLHLEEASRMLAQISTGAGHGPAFVSVLETLGQIYRQMGEHDTSRTALEQALAMRAHIPGDDRETHASILVSMGSLMFEQGILDQAETYYRRALAVHEQAADTDHPQVGHVLTYLAMIKHAQGDDEQVEAMYRRGLAILEQAYGPDHTKVGAALNNYSHFLTVSGRNDEAIVLLQRSLEIERAVVGTDSPDIAIPLASLGGAHLAAGRLHEAGGYYRQAVAARDTPAIQRRFDPLLVHSLVRLGRIEADLSNQPESERFLTRALAMWRHAPEFTDPRLAPVILDLARWLAEQQRCAEAEALLQRMQHSPDTGHTAPEEALTGCRQDPVP